MVVKFVQEMKCLSCQVYVKPGLSLQDKANKRRMLMAIDRRKKLLKHLRLVQYDAFERVCEQLGITYTFPPEYYRRATRRWIAKKAFCIKVAGVITLEISDLSTHLTDEHVAACDWLFSLWEKNVVRLLAFQRNKWVDEHLCFVVKKKKKRLNMLKVLFCTSSHTCVVICVFSQVYQEVQKLKAAQKAKVIKSSATTKTEAAKSQ